MPINVIAPWHRAWIVMDIAAGLPRQRTARTVSFPHDAASSCLVTLRLDCLPWCRQKSHPAHGVVRKPSRELENKKSVRIATFLRLRIVAWFQIASRGVKTRIIGHKLPIFALRGRKGVPNRKKVAKMRGFLFLLSRRGCLSLLCNGLASSLLSRRLRWLVPVS